MVNVDLSQCYFPHDTEILLKQNVFLNLIMSYWKPVNPVLIYILLSNPTFSESRLFVIPGKKTTTQNTDAEFPKKAHQ